MQRAPAIKLVYMMVSGLPPVLRSMSAACRADFTSPAAAQTLTSMLYVRVSAYRRGSSCTNRIACRSACKGHREAQTSSGGSRAADGGSKQM